MKNQIKKMKLELKELARQIKEKKSQRKNKELNNGCGYIPGLAEMRVAYRHKHVAYSLARGRKLEQIDSGEGLNTKDVEWIINSMKDNENTRLYVVVSDKLSPSQQAVQGGHAVAAFLKKYPHTQWCNGYLIYKKDSPYGSGNLHSPYRLRSGVNQYAEFMEPDIGNKVTAYACFGPDAESALSRYKLL